MTTTAHDTAHEHPSFLAHHFDTPQQQFDAGKFGMWLFLTTEILLFSGLFCAYAVYRARHPEAFEYAHEYLDKTYGAINTLVLIFSSLTMAWAVRAAQTGAQGTLRLMLALTLLCGAGFMGIKYIEYRHKFHDHTLWGQHYDPVGPPGQHAAEKPQDPHGAKAAPQAAAPAGSQPVPPPTGLGRTPDGVAIEQTTLERAAPGPTGLSPQWSAAQVVAYNPGPRHLGPEPKNAAMFFSVYFLMTGLHGVHVLGGMAVIAWILRRAFRGEFGPHYFNPVDFVGLYWHVVDLVWIFLFPLLYLIGNTPAR